MSEELILSLNATIFSVIALYYYKRARKINTAFYMLVYYSVCAWGALLYHNHELFTFMRGNEKYTLEPFLYLTTTIFLFALPLLVYDNTKITRIEEVNSKVYFKVVYALFYTQLSLYIVLLPYVLKAILASNIGDFRDDLYDEAEAIKFPNYFFNLLCRLYMGCRNVAILIAVYGLIAVKTKRTFLRVFFISSTVFPIYIFTAYASRAVMVISFFFLGFLYVFFMGFMAKNLRRKIMLYLIIILIPIISVFRYISDSRFGKLADYMFYRYLGEAFNNYNTHFYHDLSGNTWGQAYLSLFFKIFGQRNFQTTREKWDYLDAITGVDTHVFYTFIGGLNIEFGFIGTILLGIVISGYTCKKTLPSSILSLPKLIALGMLAYTLINGAFFFVLQGDWGNLEIIFTLFFIFIFTKYRTNKYINKI